MNFLIQRIRKVIFFIKNTNLPKKSGGWEGRGVARVNDFFFFQKNPGL